MVELEPFYDRFEYLCGTSGTAGNLRGQIQEGGNPFEGPRSRHYPTPAQLQPFSHTLFGKAARELGYKPFPQPSGNLSRAYTNPLGLRLGPCTYCGFCEWFGCSNYSKASPQTTILPYLVRKPNFALRDQSEVVNINLDRSGQRATGVTFVDSSGEEWEQQADLVILSAYTMFNVQLLLHSKIGQLYDPVSNTGVVGRNYTHQTAGHQPTSSNQLTFTFRNKMSQTALPIRSWGAFMPPNGVGGGGVHWNAEMWRFLPSDFVLKTHLTERYGASFLPEDMTIQDWGNCALPVMPTGGKGKRSLWRPTQSR